MVARSEHQTKHGNFGHELVKYKKKTCTFNINKQQIHVPFSRH